MTEPEGKLLAAALDRIDTLYEMANSQQKQIDALADAVRNMHGVVSGLVEDANGNYKRMNKIEDALTDMFASVANAVSKIPRSEPVVEDVDPMTLLEEAEPTDDSFPTDIGAVERAKLQRRVHNEQDEEKGQ